MTRIFTALRKLAAGSETGATMVEYGLMLAFIALVCFSAVQALGLKVNTVFPSVTASL